MPLHSPCHLWFCFRLAFILFDKYEHLHHSISVILYIVIQAGIITVALHERYGVLNLVKKLFDLSTKVPHYKCFMSEIYRWPTGNAESVPMPWRHHGYIWLSMWSLYVIAFIPFLFHFEVGMQFTEYTVKHVENVPADNAVISPESAVICCRTMEDSYDRSKYQG